MEDIQGDLDRVVDNYNTRYFDPVKQKMDELYAAGVISKDIYFDEEAEWQFYEFWHHEGRRARMGAAMMAPDYAWWHGFYDLKHRYVHFMELAEGLLLSNQPPFPYPHVPGQFERESRMEWPRIENQ